MKKFDNLTEVAEYAATQGGREIAVIKSGGFYFVEDPGGMIRTFEKLIYEGPALDFRAS